MVILLIKTKFVSRLTLNVCMQIDRVLFQEDTMPTFKKAIRLFTSTWIVLLQGITLNAMELMMIMHTFCLIQKSVSIRL